MIKIRKEIKLLSLVIIILFFLNTGVRSTVNGGLQNGSLSTSYNSADKSNWRFTELELISQGMTDYSYDADIVVDSLQNIHIVWFDNTDYLGSGTNGAVLYKNFTAATQTWSSIYFISDECDALSLHPSIDLDSQDNLHVSWADTSTYGSSGSDADIMYRCFNATTQLWQTTEVVSTESTDMSTDSQLIVDSDGNVHVCWEDITDYNFEGTDNDIFYKYKSSTTGIWTTTQVASSGHSLDSMDASLDVDSTGNIHLVWSDFTAVLGSGADRDIIYKIYYPLVDTWSSVEVVSTVSDDMSSFPSILIDAKDNLHICWADDADHNGAGVDRDIFYRSYIQSLGTWSATEVVSIESTDGSSYSSFNTGKSMAIDSQGNIHFVWQDAFYGTNLYNAVYRVLYTDLKVWSKVELISLECTTRAVRISICIDLADHVNFVWGDETDILGAGFPDQDIFFRKYAGPPSQPFLEEIVPNPTESGSVTLQWKSVLGGDISYTVYRSTFHIYSVDELTPLDTTTDAYYTDTLSSEGVYYYAIVAENSLGQSSVSNCEYIIYELPHLREYTIVGSLLASLTIVSLVIIKLKKKE